MTSHAYERVATPGGAQLAVYRRGDPAQPTVLLVHGFPDDHRVWEHVAAQLGGEHHVVTYDVRGTGASSKPRRRADYRLDVLAEDLQAVIDHLGGDVHLVAHDWGSIQGWHLVTGAAPRGVASFTSISGPCLDHVSGWVARRARAGRRRDVLALWKSSIYMGLFQIPVLAPLLCRLGVVDLTIAAAGKAFEHPEPGVAHPAGPSARANHASIRMYAANLLPRLLHGDHGGTGVPVQVLTPTSDVFVPPVSQQDPDPRVTTIRIEAVPGGHWAPAHNPGAVAGRVAEWIVAHAHARARDDAAVPTTTRSTT